MSVSIYRGGGLTKADIIGFADWAENYMVTALDTAAPNAAPA